MSKDKQHLYFSDWWFSPNLKILSICRERYHVFLTKSNFYTHSSFKFKSVDLVSLVEDQPSNCWLCLLFYYAQFSYEWMEYLSCLTRLIFHFIEVFRNVIRLIMLALLIRYNTLYNIHFTPRQMMIDIDF